MWNEVNEVIPFVKKKKTCAEKQKHLFKVEGNRC